MPIVCHKNRGRSKDIFKETKVKMKRILAVLSMAACVTCALAQSADSPTAAGAQVAPADSFNASWSTMETQMMNVVKAMPADKYGFAPGAAIFQPSQKTEFTGVRTFGALVTHVAQANYGIGGRISGMKPDVDVPGLAGLKEKDQVVAALAASFEFVRKSIGTLTVENAFQSVRGSMTRATSAAFVMMHTADEYGQMVEYLRMNGMAPPTPAKK
jgi:hypothetical protein